MKAVLCIAIAYDIVIYIVGCLARKVAHVVHGGPAACMWEPGAVAATLAECRAAAVIVQRDWAAEATHVGFEPFIWQILGANPNVWWDHAVMAMEHVAPGLV